MKKLLVALAFFTFWTEDLFACDLCALYSSIESQEQIAGTFRLGLSEQFTGYNRLQLDGDHVENELHQNLSSSITQLIAQYDITNRISLQGSLPYIVRRYKRAEDGALEKGTENGIGDLSLITKATPYEYRGTDSSFIWQVLGGVKFPTGDSNRLKEESAEDHHHSEERQNKILSLAHGAEEHESEETLSAIHGHDLALGSGSFDFPIGTGLLFLYGKNLIGGDVQYVIRTEGQHNYRYDNDLLWNANLGRYLYLGHEGSVAAKLNLSGEYKGRDEANGESQDDTKISSLFLGPLLSLIVGDSLSAELGVDFPVVIDNSGLQAVASYRVRGALVYRF